MIGECGRARGMLRARWGMVKVPVHLPIGPCAAEAPRHTPFPPLLPHQFRYCFCCLRKAKDSFCSSSASTRCTLRLTCDCEENRG